MAKCGLVHSHRQMAPHQREAGFTLVELMIIVAIVAILAAVGAPAYVNYLNRVKQSEATNQLLMGRIEMEEFYTDHNRYARTIGCLPSFATTSTCLADCANCTRTTHRNPQGSCKGSGCYTYKLENPTNGYYRMSGNAQNIQLRANRPSLCQLEHANTGGRQCRCIEVVRLQMAFQ